VSLYPVGRPNIAARCLYGKIAHAGQISGK